MLRFEPLLGVAALGSGIALLLALVFHAALGTLLVLAIILFSTGLLFRLRTLDTEGRHALTRQIKAGLAAGVAATSAYDLGRMALVAAAHLQYDPFKTFPLFGWLMLGTGVSARAAWFAGTLYHVINGLSFSVAYCLLLGGRGWLWGVAFALALEAAMMAVYPQWLTLKPLQDFLIGSLSGHILFGSTLGIVSQWMLTKRRAVLPEASQ